MTSATATPSWLKDPEVGLCPCGCIGKRRKGGFVEKTLSGGSSLLRQAMYADDVAIYDGLLQRLDPRVKLLTVFALLIVAALVQHVTVLLAMYLGTLALAAVSRLPLSFFIKRVWLFVPIFTGIVVVPAALNVITPGTIVVPLGTWFGHQLGFTTQGLTSVALIVTRVATSISLVVLVTMTTRWSRLLAGLRALFVPRLFVLVLGMTYRYVFYLLNAVTDMYTARQARTVARDADVASGRAFVAASAGALFGKAHALSDEVHMAMVARGYDGNSRTLDAARVRLLDVEFALLALVSGGLFFAIDRILGG
jgi:cobalt ECF transporter T component CbiQ